MSFIVTVGRGIALVLLGVAISSCGGSGSSQPAAPTPTFSEGSGSYIGTQSITITDTATGATIYYTIDGTTPTTSSTKYVSGAPVQITGDLTLEAIAVVTGDRNSAVASAAYVIAPAAVPTAGVWVGTDSVTGDEVVALINAAGQSVFIRSDYTQYVGALTVSQAAITATLKGYPNFPGTFADGSISGSGALSATVNQTTSITGSLAFVSSAATSYPGDFTLGYADVSTAGSSLAAVVGSYSDTGTNDPNTGATVTIATSGAAPTSAALSSSGATSGCVLSGTISTADSTTDVYEVAYSYSGCTGAFAPLNGLAMTGLAALNNSPAQLLIAVNGPTGGGTTYGLVSSLILN
jgi:hypothetical protein